MHTLYEADRVTKIGYLNPKEGIVSKTHMGAWTLSLDHETTGMGMELLEGRYIEAPTPSGMQFFKIEIKEVVNEKLINVVAFHRFYDLAKNYVKDINIVAKNRVEACKQILENSIRSTGFTVEGYTELEKINNLRIVGYDPLKALVGVQEDNTVIKRYGGEWDFDNSKLIIEDTIGNDNGYLFTYHKNMSELNESSDRTSLITQIVPIAVANDKRYSLPELTVDSSLIDKYNDIYTKEVEFDISREEDTTEEGEVTLSDAEVISRLREASATFFEDTKADILKTSFEITTESIVNNPKYEAVQEFLRNLNTGDTVIILREKNLKLKLRVRAYDYDTIAEDFISLTINNIFETMSQDVINASNKIDSILNGNGNVNGEAIEGVINAMQVKMKAMRDEAQPMPVRALLFEDRVKASKTYGAMAIGSCGFEIASRRSNDDKDWDWRTFGSGQGFVADWLIGKLKTVLIQNMDASFEIDLNKSGGAIFRNHGMDAIKIANNTISLYNWGKDGEEIGGVFSLLNGSNPDKPIVSLGNTHTSAVSISYKDTQSENGGYTFPAYLMFDKRGILGNKHPMTACENMTFENNSLFFGLQDECEMYMSALQDMIVKTKKGFIVADKDNGHRTHYLSPDSTNHARWNADYYYAIFKEGSFAFFNNGKDYFFKENGKNSLWSMYDFNVDKNLHVNGNITCSGKKNNIQETRDYGIRELYAVESTENYFQDICEAVFTVEPVINEDNSITYERIILIDNIYKQLVNLQGAFLVDIHKVGWGDYRIKEQTEDYFIVESDRADFTFKYTITGKRKGFEDVRVAEAFINKIPERTEPVEVSESTKRGHIRRRLW